MGADRSSRIFNLLRLHARIRWEIVEHFIENIRSNRIPADKAIFCNQIRDSLDAVEEEEKEAGLYQASHAITVFDAAQRQDILPFLEALHMRRTELRAALASRDLDVVKERLSQIRELQLRFMPVAADRYAEAVKSECALAHG